MDYQTCPLLVVEVNMIKVSRIEALLDGISQANNFHRADSESYQLRNPLMLKSYSVKPGRHPITENGVRIFDSVLGGIKSGLFDLQTKLEGRSNSGLKSSDTLRNLLKVYGLKTETEMNVVIFFIRKALRTPEIDQLTPLSYFLN